MHFVQFIVENILILIVTMSLFLWSAYVGFVGIAFGHFRSENEVTPDTLRHFIPYYQKMEKGAWGAYIRGDDSVLVALLLFGTFGFILGPMFAVSKAKKVEKLPVIDRRKV